jgi:PAS domain S-box-containing protein
VSRQSAQRRSTLGTVVQRSQTVDTELVRLFDLSLDLFCVAGFDGYLKRVNRAFERTLGYTHEELMTRPFIEFAHPEDVQAARDALAELAAGKDIVGFESRIVCADGSIRWLEWNTSTRPEEGYLYGVARDVTDRRVAVAKLDALRRVATLVAAGVPPEDLFAVVAEEITRIVDVPITTVARYESDDTATESASFSRDPRTGQLLTVGSRWSLEGTNLLRLVRETTRPARIDDYTGLDGQIAELAR